LPRKVTFVELGGVLPVVAAVVNLNPRRLSTEMPLSQAWFPLMSVSRMERKVNPSP